MSARPAFALAAALLALAAPGCAARRPATGSAVILTGVPARSYGPDACGPGALSSVLNYLGDPVTPEHLQEVLPRAPAGGVLSVDLLLEARRRGYDAELARGDLSSLERLLREDLPAILMLKLRDLPGASRDLYHYVVIDGIDPPRSVLRAQFGDGKTRWLPWNRIRRLWKEAGFAQLTVRPAPPQPEPDAPLRRALDLEREGRHDEAAEAYRALLADRPTSARAWANLGNVEAARGNRAEARKAYERALSLAPADRDALNNLAWLLLQEGGEENLAAAEALARRAVLQGGDRHAATLDTLARILAARGRCAEAVSLQDSPEVRQACAKVPPGS